MRRFLLAAALPLALPILGRPPAVFACSPIALESGGSCPESLRGLCQTLAGDAPPAEKRAAIREALRSDDPDVRAATPFFLGALSEQMDLRPYADLLKESCAGRPGCEWRPEHEGWSQLRFDSREARLDVLERTMRSGGTVLSGGMALPRWLAAQVAVWQGLDELRPLVEEYLATLHPAERKAYRLDDVLTLLALTGGAETPADAPGVAAARLAAMSDEELGRRMDEDESFRRSVLDAAAMGCRGQILTGRPLPACGGFATLVERQKARIPESRFTDGCGFLIGNEKPLPRWLNALHTSLHGASPVPAEELPQPTDHSPTREAIDPCTLPEAPFSEHWPVYPSASDGTRVALEDLSAKDGAEVGIVEGIAAHAAGETVRLRLRLRDRSGAAPSFPVVVRVSVDPQSGASVSAPGKRQRCAALHFFWNRAASEGTSLPDFDEIELTLGAAALAGVLPDPGGIGGTIPVWSATTALTIQAGRLLTEGSLLAQQEATAVFDVRPRGAAPRAGGDPFAVLLRPRARPGEVEWFGPNLEPGSSPVVRQAMRQYVATLDPSGRADAKRFACRARPAGGETAPPETDVTFRRLGASKVFVGSLILLPDGDPIPETETAIVRMPGGESELDCEARPR